VRSLVRSAEGLQIVDSDQPGAVDYLVEMRRYDEDQTLSALLARGEARSTLGRPRSSVLRWRAFTPPTQSSREAKARRPCCQSSTPISRSLPDGS
jgi:hypothetical protein